MRRRTPLAARPTRAPRSPTSRWPAAPSCAGGSEPARPAGVKVRDEGGEADGFPRAAARRTTHGVRLWPVSVPTHTPVRVQMSFTVWSPLRAWAGRQGATTSGAGLEACRRAAGPPPAAPRGTHCVEASSKPSGLYAAAIVDRGGGSSVQYEALQRRSESASAQPRSPASTSPGAHTAAGTRPELQCRAVPSSRAASSAKTPCRLRTASPMTHAHAQRTAAHRRPQPRGGARAAEAAGRARRAREGRAKI